MFKYRKRSFIRENVESIISTKEAVQTAVDCFNATFNDPTDEGAILGNITMDTAINCVAEIVEALGLDELERKNGTNSIVNADPDDVMCKAYNKFKSMCNPYEWKFYIEPSAKWANAAVIATCMIFRSVGLSTAADKLEEMYELD